MKERVRSGNPYMSIEKFPNKVIAYYSQGAVFSVEVTALPNEEQMRCADIVYKTGDSYHWRSDKLYLTGLIMYGIAISKDGKYLFAQQDMNGLVCLDLKTGAVIWKTKTRAEISHLFVCDEVLCCSKSWNEIQLIDISTGAVIKSHKTPNNNRFEVLNEQRILNHTSARQWEVLDPETLEVVETVAQKDLDRDCENRIWRRLYQDWK